MFTTGNHWYLYCSVIAYSSALLLFLTGKDRGSYLFLSGGFLIHLFYLLGRGWIGGVFIGNSVVEGPFFLPWSLALVAMVQKLKHHDTRWGFLLIPVVLLSIFAAVHPKGIIPPTPQKITIWAFCFFIFEVMAHALFYAGAIFAILQFKKTDIGFEGCIIWGFVMYSIAQITGAVWSFIGWGNTFNWSSRHLASAAIWTLYAACLHLRFLPNWTQGKRAAFVIFSGIFVFIITSANYLREMGFPRIGG